MSCSVFFGPAESTETYFMIKFHLTSTIPTQCIELGFNWNINSHSQQGSMGMFEFKNIHCVIILHFNCVQNEL